MQRTSRHLLLRVLVAGAVVAVGRPAAAQLDLSGEWGVRYHEDYWHRQAGPEIGDYVGLPINDAARMKAESWKESVLAIPERQCIPHVATYFMRGPANIRITKVIDPVTQQQLGYSIVGMFGRADRTIWLDGRPHPSKYARHTWAGFSTGKWEGNQLTVTTTHIKMGWIQRNGVPASPNATLTEHFVRHDNYLTLTSIVDDPAFLTEPFIRTTNWVQDLNLRIGPYACGPAQITEDEAAGRPKGYVPHFLPGTNDQVAEFTSKHGIPADAAKGGAETTYPEFLETLKKWAEGSARSTKAGGANVGGDPLIGAWLLNRGKSTFSGTIPEKRVIRMESVGDGVHCFIDTYPMANDSGFNRVEFTASYDGGDYPVKGSALETVSLKRIDLRTVERIGKVKGQAVETVTAKVSADGQTLAMTTKGTANGVAYSSVQLFERQ